MKFKAFFFLLFLLTASLLSAQTADENPCELEQNQMNMNACAQLRYDSADVALNQIYKKLMALGAGPDDDIREAQRNWLKYRDSHCDCMAGIYEGGSIVPMIRLNCLRRLTEDRTRELQAIYDMMEM